MNTVKSLLYLHNHFLPVSKQYFGQLFIARQVRHHYKQSEQHLQK